MMSLADSVVMQCLEIHKVQAVCWAEIFLSIIFGELALSADRQHCHSILHPY